MEKLWVFDYTTARVLCIFIKNEDDVQDVLEAKGLKPDDCLWMSTDTDTEVEYFNE